MLTAVDVAWATGFIEGEGTFSARKNSPQVAVSQVQREPLERLQRMFGGSIILVKNGVRKDGTTYKSIYRWCVGGTLAASVTMTVLGLLSPRRFDQAMAALDCWKKAVGRGNRIACRHGHRYTEENVFYRKLSSGKTTRRCRICADDYKVIRHVFS